MDNEPNPKLYRELSEPFDSIEDANRACSEFFDKLAVLRKEYRIRDVYCVAQFAYMSDDGREAEGLTSVGFGDQFKHESMLAYSLGVVQTERQEYIGSLMSKALRRKERRA
jgi:hypothetical protein